MLCWRCLEANRALLEYATSAKALGGMELLENCLALAWLALGDPSKSGLVHCAVFVVLLLSSARGFAVALNADVADTPGK